MSLFDPIRACLVEATPEEIVRQNLIRKMIDHLGYPKGLLGVEKELSFMAQKRIQRRVDIVAFLPGLHGLEPLLIIECKAAKMAGSKEQVFAYNTVFKAPFIAIADNEGVELMWREELTLRSIFFLPSYESLKEKVAICKKHSSV